MSTAPVPAPADAQPAQMSWTDKTLVIMQLSAALLPAIAQIVSMFRKPKPVTAAAK